MNVETPSRKRRSEPREIRRLQLIMAALDSIAKRGFSDTTLKHVTEGASLSQGVANYHFESKEALYDATLGYLAREHYETWTRYYEQAKPTPAHRLAAIIAADFDKDICTSKRLAVWFAFWGQVKYRPNYQKIHNQYDDERHELIERLCAELIEYGEYDLNASQVARSIVALSDGAWLCLMLYPKGTTAEEYHSDNLLTLAKYFPKHFPLEP
ncbi:transcriptional regulator, TetR family [Cognatiyoonia sediminum]|uniref:Transcriptional regulator, TetR family n=1 Tax=Cognatiyoonia sediminum TaxID=1508389 RepID=A0A1M5NQK7_9RHOB|nr:TetR family transcriptional regulator C-terminal domain-containing protein [Cognatiyoonia sediminum]SHG91469.1 transcriptional regulator, TetR family [Cognatiyoonia sediminum]